MKILIATAVYHPMTNGVAVFSHNLAIGLAKRGHEVVVVCPSQTGRNYTRMIDNVKTFFLKSVNAKVYPDQIHAVPEKRKFLGVRWPNLWYKHGLRVSVFPAREIRKILREFRPDVVHVQVSDPIGLSVVYFARRYNIPVVTTEHNQPEVLTDPLHMPKLIKKPANALLSAYFRNRQSKSDFVTMPTEQAIRNLLAKREIGVPVAAISNGVDLTNFKPGKASKEIYKKYNLPEEKPIVLYVGRVDPEKRIDVVIKAFQKVSDEMPEALMIIVGDGVDRARLEKLVKKLKLDKSVRFLGKVLPPDLYELYKIGTVFATASEIETQGIVLIEAAATGLPLVAVDKGAVAEICKNRENGFLCRPGNVDEIARALKEILANIETQKKFSKKSLALSKEHDFENTLDRFTNIYQRLVDKNMV